MENETNNSQQDTAGMMQAIEDLRSKYDNLSKQVEMLESNKVTLGDDIKKIHGEFEQINKSMGEVLQKLNGLYDEYDDADMEMDEDGTTVSSMMRLLTNPLRKLAVGTLSAVYAVTDKTIEKTSSLRESLEDIIAEAHYSHKKKNIPPMENG